MSKRFLWLSLLTIATVVLVSYQPSIKIGFLGDDWWFLGKAASLDLPTYLAFYFDPRTQIFWYRPLYGILLLLEYLFFGSAPEAYHVGQILLHAINCLLLFAVVWQVSRRERLALLAAIIYAVLPVNNLAIFWIAVQDPLAMVFYLGSVWCWVVYLQTRRPVYYVLAFGAFILALLGKEASVFLPATLFLIDRLVIAKPASLSGLFRRYSLFGVTFAAYLVLEQRVQTYAYFPNRWGYSLGFHVLENLAHYLSLIVFPWGEDMPMVSYIVLAAVLLALVSFGIIKRSKLLLLFAVQVLLTIAPALLFPTTFFQARYLYFAAAVSAILIALLLEIVWKRLGTRRATLAFASVAAVVLVLAGSAMTSAAADNRAEEARQARVPIRDIFQAHPAYPSDTYLYFVEPPYPMIMRNLSGMFLMRYGSGVTVWNNDPEWGGVDENRFAGLREHKNSWVYYFDESNRRYEVKVDPAAQFASAPATPVRFENGIRLEGFEITSATLNPGNDVALVLYWATAEPLDRNYTVFVHLVNEQGETILGEDAQPRRGLAPTKEWRLDKLVSDGHMLNITPDVPPGTYHLEIGLYYLPTQERLSITDENGHLVGDHVVIESLTVVE